MVSFPSAQKSAEQLVPAGYNPQWPEPSQVPSEPQLDGLSVGQAARGSIASAGTSAQVPSSPGNAQLLQLPSQALSQQTPSTQRPLRQPSPTSQGSPRWASSDPDAAPSDPTWPPASRAPPAGVPICAPAAALPPVSVAAPAPASDRSPGDPSVTTALRPPVADRPGSPPSCRAPQPPKPATARAQAANTASRLTMLASLSRSVVANARAAISP
jgi:hypothetical protein